MKKNLKSLSRQKLTKSEKKKYVMPTSRDYEILSKVKQLEKLNLSKSEKFLVKFIRTQLERDWRKWLIKKLDKILLKYKKKNACLTCARAQRTKQKGVFAKVCARRCKM